MANKPAKPATAKPKSKATQATKATQSKAAFPASEVDHIGGVRITPEFIHGLAAVLDSAGLSEIEVAEGDRHIRIARTTPAPMVAVSPSAADSTAPAPPASPANAAPVPHPPAPGAPTSPDSAAPATDSDSETDTSKAIKSPMVGTAYLSPEPGAPAFATIGGKVKAGDTILIIEAMKVMNPITAPSAGTLTAILVDNNQPVEFDQPLFIIA